MLTPEDFRAMPMDLKLETLHEKGYWLSTVNDFYYQVKIYKLMTFYVQTWFDQKTQQIIELVSLAENPLEDILGFVRLDTLNFPG